MRDLGRRDPPKPRPRESAAHLQVCLVTETFPPEINGVAMTLDRLVTGLRDRGHDVTVVRPRQRHECGRDEHDPGERLHPSIPLPFYRALRLGLPTHGAPFPTTGARRPDVVHVATEGFLGISALRTSLRRRIPVLSSYHTRFDDSGRHYGLACLAPWLRAHLRSFHNKTKATLVPSPSIRDSLVDQGFRNCHVLGRGLDSKHFHPTRRSEGKRAAWGIGESDPILICTSRLAPEKNLGLALRAFHAVRERVPEVRLVLVGSGPLQERLRGQAGVVIVGAVPHAEVGAHLAAADIFLFPSETETFGNVLTEAMASGLATVSFDYAASAMHVQHGVNGLQVALGDDEGFIRESVRVASDAGLRRRLGMAARDAAAALDWERIVRQFEAYLTTAANGGWRNTR